MYTIKLTRPNDWIPRISPDSDSFIWEHKLNPRIQIRSKNQDIFGKEWTLKIRIAHGKSDESKYPQKLYLMIHPKNENHPKVELIFNFIKGCFVPLKSMDSVLEAFIFPAKTDGKTAHWLILYLRKI